MIYLIGIYVIFQREKSSPITHPEERVSSEQPAAIWVKSLLYCAALVVAAIYMSYLGNDIARIPVAGIALGGTFVGGLLIAVITSLPEVVVSLSAIKLGFWDMGLANIFGSNMFNMAIIPITDLALGKTPILSVVSGQHVLTAGFVILTTALVVLGLIYRTRRKAPALSWDTIGVLCIYLTANLINFYFR